MVSKEYREAYEKGIRDSRYMREHHGEWLLFGPIHGRPSDEEKKEAYNKGLRGEQLDKGNGGEQLDKDNGGEQLDKGNSSEGGCYLTTACINSKGLPDNCLELTVLRRFRDKILMRQSFSKKAVNEYYKLAPEIVNSINHRGNNLEIWSDVYKDIRIAVHLALTRDFDGAFKHYKEMTQKYKKQLLK